MFLNGLCGALKLKSFIFVLIIEAGFMYNIIFIGVGAFYEFLCISKEFLKPVK